MSMDHNKTLQKRKPLKDILFKLQKRLSTETGGLKPNLKNVFTCTAVGFYKLQPRNTF